jgi:mRNA interferase MazF
MRRDEIWLINLDPTVGAEIRKTRPALVVSDNAVGILPLKVIVPITDWKDRYAIAPWMVRLEPDRTNGLSKPSAADAFQVRSVAQQRFTHAWESVKYFTKFEARLHENTLESCGAYPRHTLQSMAKLTTVANRWRIISAVSWGASQTMNFARLPRPWRLS